MTSDFASILASINPVGQEGLHSRKRLPSIEVLPVYAAKRNSDGLDALLVEGDSTLLAGIEEWPQFHGVEIELVPLDQSKIVRVHIQLVELRYQDVFGALCDDVCDRIATAEEPLQAIRLLHQRLYHWRDCFRPEREKGLSEEKQVGLFGELVILRDLFMGQCTPATAVAAWRGCRGADQDFQMRSFAMEVKTTRQTLPDKLAISSVGQLDEEGIECMVLTVVLIDQHESASESLPGIVEEIREELDEPIFGAFNDGLIAVGYLDVHEPIYRGTRYQLMGRRHFRVSEEFPRLLREAIPGGVTKVKYSISFGACVPFEIDEDDLHTSIAIAVRSAEDE